MAPRVDAVWQALAQEFPAMAPSRASLAAAVNAEYATFATPVADGDEVAFLPPVSGDRGIQKSEAEAEWATRLPSEF